MEETWNKIGDYFSERHKWDEAVQYYEKARNIDQVKPQSNIYGLEESTKIKNKKMCLKEIFKNPYLILITLQIEKAKNKKSIFKGAIVNIQ